MSKKFSEQSTTATLFCLGRNFTCIGARRVASFLKSKGIKVRTIFVPMEITTIDDLSENCQKQLLGSLTSDTVIAMSFYSNCTRTAKTLTLFTKQNLSAPIMWGGVHATAAPEESLTFCDSLCIGEGEQSFFEYVSEIAQSGKTETIPNIWLSTPDGIIKNGQRPLERNLDSLPFQDYDFSDHQILLKNVLRPLTIIDMKKNFGFAVTRMMTFGCPYRCTYCINDRYQELDKSHAKIRRYSVDYFIKETIHILDKLPFVHYLRIDDDAFLSLPIEVIEEFCQKYKKEINLPFAIGGIRPETVKRDKLEMLIGSGLLTVRMGIQSGSERTQKELFKRHFSQKNIIDVTGILNSFKKELRPPFYDIILDNPWEKPDDKLQTLHLLRNIPHPYYLSVFSLTFFPGTELYQRAISDKIIDGYKPHMDFQDIRKTYINILIYASCIFHLPDWLYNKLIKSKRISDESRQYPLVYAILLLMNLFHRLFSFYFNPKFLRGKLRRVGTHNGR